MPDSISVFLSYSRKDHAVCDGLCDNLRLQGLDVKIDKNDIAIGKNIEDDIVKLIADSTCSVVVVSENSLQSTWVIWEVQRRKLQVNSRLIPVYLDESYLDNDYIKSIHSKLKNDIAQLRNEVDNWNDQSSPSNHLDSKKNSLLDFKNNLSQVIEYIRSTNGVDLRIENYLDGFNALYCAITGKAKLENSNIITPPLFKNADIDSRIREIESLVAEDNMKEAAKRTIDFVNDFYPRNIEYRRIAVKTSAKIHAGEKNLSKGNELMECNAMLADQILDLIYQSYPNAA